MADDIDHNIEKIGEQIGEQLGPPEGELRKRSWAEIRSTGLLWYINTLLHPRGFAIAVYPDDEGQLEGWALVGDGSEPMSFVTKEIADVYGVEVPNPVDADAHFRAFEEMLEEARHGR